MGRQACCIGQGRAGLRSHMPTIAGQTTASTFTCTITHPYSQPVMGQLFLPLSVCSLTPAQEASCPHPHPQRLPSRKRGWRWHLHSQGTLTRQQRSTPKGSSLWVGQGLSHCRLTSLSVCMFVSGPSAVPGHVPRGAFHRETCKGGHGPIPQEPRRHSQCDR